MNYRDEYFFPEPEYSPNDPRYARKKLELTSNAESIICYIAKMLGLAAFGYICFSMLATI